MKETLTRIFWPILNIFESGTSDTSNYKPSHRTILMVVGSLFLVLSVVSGLSMYATGQLAAFIPIGVFFLAGFVALVVGTLGSDAAVAKIWGNR